MPDAPVIYDLAASERDVNEAASRLYKYWVSFLLLSAAIFITTINISDLNLLLGQSLQVPLVKVNVSLFGYALGTTLIYLSIHIYLLLEFLFLNRKLSAYEESLHQTVKIEADRLRMRERLHTFAFVRMLTSPQGLLELLSGVLSIATVVFVPLAVLLVLNLRFVAYHDELVSWVARSTVVFDILASWFVWTRLVKLEFDGGIDQKDKWNIFRNAFVQYYICAVIIPFVLIGSSFKGEWIDGPWSDGIRAAFPMKYFLQSSPHAQTAFFRTYIAPPPGSQIPADTSRDFLKGRNLVSAILVGLDLRDIDGSGTNFANASLQKSKLSGANLSGANLQGAHLEGAQLQNANLSKAELQGAFIGGTQLQGATLDQSYMQGARLADAQMQAASLRSAWLQGARLERVQLVGAVLDGAYLMGADVADSNLQGVSLNGAELQGVDISLTSAESIRGADFSNAHVWHAILGFPLVRNLLLAKATNLGFQTEVPLMMLIRATEKSGTNYEVIVSGSLFGVSDSKLRDEIKSRMSMLSPEAWMDLPDHPTAERVQSELEKNWRTLQDNSISPEALQQQKYAVFKNIACQSNVDSRSDDVEAWDGWNWAMAPIGYDGAPYVAEALIRMGQLQSLGQQAPQLALALSETPSCPGAAQISANLRAVLNAIRNAQ
jgi:hypothetical protein